LLLVMEGHGTQGQDRLTGSAHVSDVRLKPTRGEKHAQLASIVHVTGSSTRPDGLARNAGDVNRRVIAVPDADRATVAVNTVGADVDVVTAKGDGLTGEVADADVVVAGTHGECVASERGVIVPGSVTVEREPTASGVVAAPLVAEERLGSSSRVTGGGAVAEKGKCSICGVGRSHGVAEKRSRAGGRVIVRGVAKQGSRGNSGVEAADGVALERIVPNRRVVSAAAQAKKSVLPFRRVAPGIAAIRRRDHRLRFW